MRKRIPKMEHGGPYKSDIDRKQQGGEGALYSENPMFYDYKEQLYGTGPSNFRGDGLAGRFTQSGSGLLKSLPGAPDPSMYGGNQRAYIKALNKFGRQTAKDYRDLYTGGVNPSRISTSRLGGLEGAKEYQEAYNKLYGYINSEIAGIDQANELVGRRGRNKRTKGRGNKNRLFR